MAEDVDFVSESEAMVRGETGVEEGCVRKVLRRWVCRGVGLLRCGSSRRRVR